ncbi:hypothetical protein [Kitasatospora camelliae]|uniref:Secreted protein with PEP-CTERM sorting signal n=1 Tax=Kitasatospora camelliae TaxID=3156397 RepID=A0AAU8JW20_9ACTN
MRKHPVDLFSLVAGGLFTVVAGLYLAAALGGLSVSGHLVVPVVLIGLGVGGLAGAVLAVSRRGRGPEDHD